MKRNNTLEKVLHRYNPGMVEVRKAEGSNVRTIGGYASVFNTETNLGYITESVDPKAFDGVLDNDVRCLFNHDPNQILGRTTSGTCRLSVDSKGLLYENDMSETSPIALHVMDAIQRGDVSQSSFAFSIDEEKWTKKRSDSGLEYWHRTVMKVSTLYDVSPVTYPAYEDASVEELGKSLEEFCKREMPEELQNVVEMRRKHFMQRSEEITEQMEGASKIAYERLKRQYNWLVMQSKV